MDRRFGDGTGANILELEVPGLTPKEQRESERDIRNLCDAKIKSKDAATEEWKITYNESVAML